MPRPFPLPCVFFSISCLSGSKSSDPLSTAPSSQTQSKGSQFTTTGHHSNCETEWMFLPPNAFSKYLSWWRKRKSSTICIQQCVLGEESCTCGVFLFVLFYLFVLSLFVRTVQTIFSFPLQNRKEIGMSLPRRLTGIFYRVLGLSTHSR